MDTPPPPPLHRNRDYQRLWLAHAFSSFGSQATHVALPLVLLAATHSVTAFGIVTFVEIATPLVAGLPAGVLVDRLSRRAVMLVCDLGRAVVFTLFALAVLTDRVSLPLAVVVAVVNSVLSSPFGPAAAASMRHVVPKSQLTTAVSLSQARSASVMLAGPMVGAALYTVTPVLPFVVDALSYLASACCVALVRLPRRAPEAKTRTAFLPDLTTGLREVRRSPFLRYTLVNAALVNFAFAGIVLVLISRGAGQPGGGFHNGLVIAASGAGNLLGSLVSGWAGRTFSPRSLVLTICWSTALVTPLLAVFADPAGTAVLIFLCSLATPAANAVISAARLHTVPDHLLGRVQTACGLVPSLVIPFGPLLAAALLERLSSSAVLLLCSAVLAALAVYSSATGGLRQIPDLREPRTPAPVLPRQEAPARP
ncbi:MFS transporter [Kitasatospora sp. NPDC051853]|uniref:MFS transporter n=1 Tax=Kitasatospora sp. NPDC051853 TaxID=3364058 RepID=UPI0037951258